MRKKKPGIEVAVEFIRGLLGHIRNPGRLPSIDSLAQSALVSRVTMWKALNLLREEGAICCPGGGRYFYPGAVFRQDDARTAVVSRTRWLRIRDKIERDISGGIYKRGEPLPSITRLQGIYGGSYVTLKKALLSLERAGVLREQGRGFVAAQFGSVKYRSTVCMVLPGDPSGSPQLYPRLQEMVASIEQQCARSNLALEPLAYHSRNRRPLASLMGSGKIDLGYIVWIGPYDSADIASFAEAVDLLCRSGKPVAVVDEIGDFSAAVSGSLAQGVKTYTLAARSAGFAVGSFLRCLGHRTAAYLAVEHSFSWSQRRLQGLREGFESVDGMHRIVPFVYPNIEYTFQTLCVYSGITQKEYLTILEADGNKSPDNIRAIMAHYRALCAAMESTKADFPYDLSVRPIFEILKESIHRGVGPDFISALSRTIYDYLVKTGGEIFCRQLFERALHSATITAWVAANDLTALRAKKFLEGKGVQIPRQISLIGFDDIAEALANRLTTYNFNLTAIASSVLSYICGYETRSRTVQNDSPVEIEGMIIERKTAAVLSQSTGEGASATEKQH
jgi:DNA-binding LacI/PurR family transcriptional regulator/DNA-binding transcriptional regulator YhcF (GntR family)